MAIFKDQGLLTIELDTGYDITSATSAKILYQKPDGTTGEFVGAASDTTKISYSLVDGDIDQAGTWIFQSFVTIGGRNGYGGKAYVAVQGNLD